MSDTKLGWLVRVLGFNIEKRTARNRQSPGDMLTLAFAQALNAEKAKARRALDQIGPVHDQAKALGGTLASNPAFVLPTGRAQHDTSTVRGTANTGPNPATPADPGLPEPARKALLNKFFAEKTSVSVQMEGLAQTWDTLLGRADAACAELQGLGRNMAVVRQTASPADVKTLNVLAREQAEAVQSLQSRRTQMDAPLKKTKQDFDADLKNLSDAFLKDFAKRFQQRDPEAALPSLQAAYDAEEKVFRAAMDRYKADVETDAKLLTTAKPGPAQTLQTFDVGAPVTDDMRQKLLAPDVTDKDVDEIADRLASQVAKAFTPGQLGSDQVFDLSMKCTNDFKADIAKGLGGKFKAGDPQAYKPEDRTDAWDPPSARQPVSRIAQQLFQQVQQSNPNRLSDDQSTMTFNGEDYTAGEQLGKGATNVARRYKSKDGTKTVVMRSAQDWKLGDEIMPAAPRWLQVEDLNKHRMAAKSDGMGAKNVVRLLGVQATDDKVFGIFEDCAGGGADDFAKGTLAAVESGVLPPDIRNEMAREMFTEAAKGMKYLSNQGLAHNDFKSANVFLAADGTVKVGDLGEAAPVDATGLSPAGNPGSPGWAVSDTEKPSLQRDIGMMGKFLDVLADDVVEFTRSSRQRPGGAGALQRLRDAMLDPDSAKRPSIDAVLLSAYVDEAASDAPGSDASANTSELAGVKQAMIAYSRQAGKQIAQPIEVISKAKDTIRQSWRKGYSNDQEYKQHMKTIEEQNIIIAEQQELLDQINADPNVAPLLQAIRDASTRAKKSVPPEKGAPATDGQRLNT